MPQITATQADQIVKKYVKSFEKSGDHDAALELMGVLSITGPLATKEFMELPLAQKCELWRSHGWSEDNIARLCGDMIDLALGVGWRDDPSISASLGRK